MANITVGSSVEFGRFLQYNGHFSAPTPIEWIVLETDGQTATLISKYGLEVRAYHNEQRDVTWETCTLREWLNGAFMNETFTDEEQAQLQMVTVTPDVKPIPYGAGPKSGTRSPGQFVP